VPVIRSTQCTKRVTFAHTRLRYEFKLATVFCLYRGRLSVFEQGGVRSLSAIFYCCLLLPAQCSRRHSTTVLLANCAGSFYADWLPEKQLKSATAHRTVLNCVPTQSLIQLDGLLLDRRITHAWFNK